MDDEVIALFGQDIDVRPPPERIAFNALQHLVLLRAVVEREIMLMVGEVHARGGSWALIADALGSAKQSAHTRYQEKIHKEATFAARLSELEEAEWYAATYIDLPEALTCQKATKTSVADAWTFWSTARRSKASTGHLPLTSGRTCGACSHSTSPDRRQRR